MQPVIKSKILAQFPEIVHGISTKLGGNTNPPYYNNLSKYVGDDEEIVMQNRKVFFSAIGAERTRTASGNQVHSANILTVDKPGLYKETDALITTQRNLFLIISVADCLPVMIYDKSKQVIANVHSGWRGTQKEIIVKTIDKMKSEFGCNPEDMVVFIGPGISREYFEVGEDVAVLFDKQYVRPPRLTSGEPPLLTKEGTPKFNVDLKAVVGDQLLSSGIKPDNIEQCPLCTYNEKNYLHSYRRDRDKSGRMFAVIGLKEL